jgi:threonine/homoserine/homoserine lactone efflux protein
MPTPLISRYQDSQSVHVVPLISLLTIFGALALGCISPGPSFVFVTRTAVAVSRRDGLAAALGMGLGAATVSLLSLLGVRVLLSQAQWLYAGFKILGGAYLVYLAWRVWRGAGTAAEVVQTAPVSPSLWRTFLLALATQFSNPKTLIVISGIFAALLPAVVPRWMYFVIPPLQLVMETSWYAFVAIAMSSTRPRLMYLRAKTSIDRGVSGVLGALGLRLIFEGTREVI